MHNNQILFEDITTEGIWEDRRSSLFTKDNLEELKKEFNTMFKIVRLMCLKSDKSVSLFPFSWRGLLSCQMA